MTDYNGRAVLEQVALANGFRLTDIPIEGDNTVIEYRRDLEVFVISWTPNNTAVAILASEDGKPFTKIRGAGSLVDVRRKMEVCRDCGELISDCPIKRQEGMRPGLCAICNDIAAEVECEMECGW